MAKMKDARSQSKLAKLLKRTVGKPVEAPVEAPVEKPVGDPYVAMEKAAGVLRPRPQRPIKNPFRPGQTAPTDTTKTPPADTKK